jgi:Dolichyl-phosphate-mannose-protein mannosyltransferase
MARSVIAIAALAIAGLLLVANAYGFHRDELYFIVAGQHPDWGYDDQGPLTPLLSAAGVAVFGAVPIAVRILPALVIGACIVLTAAMAKEMGGGRRAQEVAALSVALSGFLLAGHIAATATYDILAWTVITWLAVRILGGANPRLWLAVGVVAGLGLLNKYTVLLLPVSLVAGMLIERRWAAFRSPWPWAGVGIALAIWAPNLLWQATHDFPQLAMARHIAAVAGSESRDQFIPLQLLLTGPLLWPIVVFGLWRLITARDARPWRSFAWAYLIALALTYQQGGKAYYMMGLIPVLFAAGSPSVAGWLGRGRRRLRLGAFGAAAAVSGAIVAVLVLPILPPQVLVSSGVHDINKESGEQIGWPELVAAVDEVVDRLPSEERSHAVIITANYGEAGAIELLGRDLPPVYSGHNSYWYWGPPADGARVAVVVGSSRSPGVGDCRSEGQVDNRLGVDNEEQGASIQVCRRLPAAWSEIWSAYRHLD